MPNAWDGLAFILIFGIIALVTSTIIAMTQPYISNQVMPAISLDPSHLPYYALRSVMRMIIALIASLLFTFIIGTWAARSTYAERILIPIIDVLQSVPVLGLLSITVLGFIKLFHGSMMGPECASIFAVFTAQVWNMTLGFYQSLKTVPANLIEASRMFHLSAWQRFWRVEVPFAMPSLLWNTMMSMSASWFFVVASEAISVGKQSIMLPGIGSYIAQAITHADKAAIFYSIITMFLVIIIYDQILFRPLVAWGEKFKTGETDDETESNSWLLTLFQRSPMLKKFSAKISIFTDAAVNFKWFRERHSVRHYHRYNVRWNLILHGLIIFGLLATGALIIDKLYNYLSSTVTRAMMGHIFLLGFYTALRVLATIIFCTLFLVPVGVWIGLRPRLTEIIQPIIQFLAAFPAYLLYPIFVYFIVTFSLNANIWTTPLFLLGTLWYVLFNVIAGTSALPKDLHEVADCFELSGWTRWRRFILPGIFPYYITGAITAAGGAWNASIVAEAISWGSSQPIPVQGIGYYIKTQTTLGNFPNIVLGIAVLCIMVIILNRLLWRPLYVLAQKRYQLD